MLPSLSKHFIKAMKAIVRRRGPTQEELAVAKHDTPDNEWLAKVKDMHTLNPAPIYDRRAGLAVAR